MKISTIIDQIDMGSIALPEFQRGYVWTRKQVRQLMGSLYRRHPVGSLLVWVTPTESATSRGQGGLQPGVVKLLLDGQQRITSLYGIVRGRPPKFFSGNENAFSGLRFHLEDETFEFYGPVKMKDDPLWIDVTDLMHKGVGPFLQQILGMVPEQKLDVYINRLSNLAGIKDVGLHVEEVTGADKTVDVVVDIFNTVNSGGTKLSKGDLALAKICAQWPEAREEMNRRLHRWAAAGFEFRLEWLLRCVNALIKGEALFSALKDVQVDEFQQGLARTEKMVDNLLNMIASRLGLDHDRVVGSRYTFPLMVRYLNQRGGQLLDPRERDGLLYWYIHTFLWGRYAGSTETVLNQDLGHIENPAGALDRLIEQLRSVRGDLRLQPNDLLGWSRGARFYPLLYMLTRVCRAQDWATGIELKQTLLGPMSHLELHHIFPKARLYEAGYARAEVNALANLTFLTKETNLLVADREPADYLEEFAARQPGCLESHWIPMDRRLWRLESYPQFLSARRELLAKAANEFLDSLRAGLVPAPEEEAQVSILERGRPALGDAGAAEDEDEDQILRQCNDWVKSQGLAGGEFYYEIADPRTGEATAVVDLAWPEGLQAGFSEPVALLLDKDPEREAGVSAAGFRFFTDPHTFRAYLEREVLGPAQES